MLPKGKAKKDSSNRIDKKTKELQGATRKDDPMEPLAIMGNTSSFSTLFYLFIHLNCSALIEDTALKPELLAWSSRMSNKIHTVELKTKQDYAKFDGVKLLHNCKSSIHIL